MIRDDEQHMPISQEEQDAGLARGGRGIQEVIEKINPKVTKIIANVSEQVSCPEKSNTRHTREFLDTHCDTLACISSSSQSSVKTGVDRLDNSFAKSVSPLTQHILKGKTLDNMNPYEEVLTPFGVLAREDAFRLMQEGMEAGNEDQFNIFLKALNS
jgi:hypothetical protein